MTMSITAAYVPSGVVAEIIRVAYTLSTTQLTKYQLLHEEWVI